MRTLRRTVIIREDELPKLTRETIKKRLYDHISYEALTYKEIQQENMLKILTGKPHPRTSTLPDIYEELLFRENNLYDRRYLGWTLTVDYPDGQIYVSSGPRYSRQALYRVTLEKDFV